MFYGDESKYVISRINISCPLNIFLLMWINKIIKTVFFHNLLLTFWSLCEIFHRLFGEIEKNKIFNSA